MTSGFTCILPPLACRPIHNKGPALDRCKLSGIARPVADQPRRCSTARLDDGRYVMKLRDDVPNIWFHGNWGLFGGGDAARVDGVAALRREVREGCGIGGGSVR